MLDANNKYALQAVDRAVAVLSLFDNQHPTLSFSEICERLDLPKGSAKRLLASMESHGLVTRDELGRYSLGVRLLEWGAVVAENLSLLKVSRPFSAELAKRTGETTILVEPRGDEQLYLDKIESYQAVRIASRVGTRHPMYYGQGRIFLAYMPPDEVERYLPETLPRYTPNTITDRQKFLESIAQVRRQGYLVEWEEYYVGMVGVGAPIFDRRGTAVGLIGCLCITGRTDQQRLQQIIEWTREAARAASAGLGYTG